MENNPYVLRRQTVAGKLSSRRLDALLVWLSPNLRYLTGFTGSNGALLLTEAETLLFTDSRYTIQAAQQTTCRVRIATSAMVLEVAAAIARKRLRRVGYEPARMTCDVHQAIDSRLPLKASLLPAGGWIEELRMVKSAAELAAIRRSVEVNSQAFEQAVARLKPGMRERDLAAELEHRMRKLGAEKPSFDTIVAAGEHSALPHAEPGAARIERGLVVIDMGAMVDGYASDMTRMLYVGAPGAKVKRMYRAVLEAQFAAIDAVKPGARTAAVDLAARRVLKGYGLDKAFTHSTGHGLGLEIHEPPRLGRKDKLRLAEGMAVTVEPGVYVEGLGGIRIEDTVVVTRSGCEILTPTSKELRVI